jgi:hypothetical protein
MTKKTVKRYGGIGEHTAGIVKHALAKGYDQHVIASYFLDNQGRVSEIKTGKKHVAIPPATQLPADFPVAA